MSCLLNDDLIKNIAEKYGTPVYIFDEDELNLRVERIYKILNDGLSRNKIALCYSVKANPFLIPSLLKGSVVDKLEVCSPGELEICRNYSVPGEMIIYSGVRKEEEDITEALSYGADIVTAESLRHFELIRRTAKKLDKEVKVLLRLSSKSQFGMSAEDIEEILENRSGDPLVSVEGIHYFAGTQRLKLRHQKEELKELAGFISGLRERYGIALARLEYGPGLGYPYFVGDDRENTLRPLEELCCDLREISGMCDLTVEMGRFTASSCGYYITKVADKKRSFDRNWCILDGGINHLNYQGQMMGMMVPVIRRIPLNGAGPETGGLSGSGEEEEWALCGALCTTNDVLVRSIRMTEPELSELFVFCNAGAYSVTEAMNLFLSRDMPAVVLAGNGKDELLRGSMETWRLNCRLTGTEPGKQGSIAGAQP
ncbi:MAG TPA: diaminopimelate decarboxylase [Lachnospiraceae bacterium]|nr:diaminopimelate decarboxylase [Lachnospiraceae bacterium]